MEFNNKKLEKSSKIINYTIAIVLCGFLIALTGKVIDDIDQWRERPRAEEFQDSDYIDSKRAEIDSIANLQEVVYEKRKSVENTVELARNKYLNEKQSFENWLAARSTIGSPNEDEEVITRARELDEYFKVQQDWDNELNQIQLRIDEYEVEKEEREGEIAEEQNRAYDLQSVAFRKYELNIFLIRLALILPILLLGIFFIMKFRKHKYWPLFLGFVLFSFYAFFFGLVPYMPSYGGYVRYTVGIILSVLLGVYFINRIRAFIERKRNELKESSGERAKNVKHEVAEKAFDNHMCPSCGKDFIVTNWERAKNKKNPLENFSFVTNFCRYCGLELFRKCKSCGNENYAHLPFCSNCGDKT